MAIEKIKKILIQTNISMFSFFWWRENLTIFLLVYRNVLFLLHDVLIMYVLLLVFYISYLLPRVPLLFMYSRITALLSASLSPKDAQRLPPLTSPRRQQFTNSKETSKGGSLIASGRKESQIMGKLCIGSSRMTPTGQGHPG